MKTTKTLSNIIKAKELLEIRDSLKQLKKRETELKHYFADLMQDDSNLLVGTAINISKHTASRTSYDTKYLDTYFATNNIRKENFQRTTSYQTLKIQGGN